MADIGTDLVLNLVSRDGKLEASLLRGTGQVLAKTPVVLDEAALSVAAEPAAYGRALSDAILRDPVGAALQQAGSARVRLVVAPDAGQAHDLRWECLLRAGDGGPVPLAAHPATPFSRWLSPGATGHSHSPQTDWPLRIVAAISNPSDLSGWKLPPLDVGLERAELERAFAPLRGLVEVTWVEPPVSLDRICQALESAPAIFHFLGHGARNPTTGETALLLEHDADRSAHPVDQDEWRERLAALPAPRTWRC